MHPPKILQLPLSPARHRWKGSRQRNAAIFLYESRVPRYSLLICHESYWMQELFAGRQIRYCITLALSLSPHPYEVFRRQNRRTGLFVGVGASAQRFPYLVLAHAEAAVWASISLQPPGRAGRQRRSAGAHLPRSRRAARGAAALPRCPHGLRRGIAVRGSPRPGPRRGELVERDRRASPSREGAGRRSRGPGWRRGRAGEVGTERCSAEREGRSAELPLAGSLRALARCSGSSVRGFLNDRALHSSPRFPAELRGAWSSRRVGDADPLGISAELWVKATRLPFIARESV